MADPLSIPAALLEIKARTGLPWREVGALVGMTGEYARKVATKPTSAGAGRAFESNVRDFLATGAQQVPVQREQKVRQKGGAPSAPAAPRAGAVRPRQFKVERSVYKGTTRDGWAVNVTAPKGKSATGDREDARHAIIGATRRAAQGRRRVMFRVTVQGPDDKAPRTVELGGRGGYDASSALRGMNAEGRDPFGWFVSQGLERYRDDGDEYEPRDILEVEVIGLA